VCQLKGKTQDYLFIKCYVDFDNLVYCEMGKNESNYLHKDVKIGVQE